MANSYRATILLNKNQGTLKCRALAWRGRIFIYFSSGPFPLISLTRNDTQHSAPVAGEHIPGREVLVVPPALGVGLHVEHGEHAPVGQVDDAAHTRP